MHGFRDFALGASEQVGQHVVSIACGQTIEAVFADAAIFYEARGFELREVCGDSALAHDQDFLKFGN